MLFSSHQNADKNPDIKVTKRSFGIAAGFECLGPSVTNQHLIQEEIKSRINSDNGYHHSIQGPLSYRLLSEHVNTQNSGYIRM
jgi:hypothetical protein